MKAASSGPLQCAPSSPAWSSGCTSCKEQQNKFLNFKRASLCSQKHIISMLPSASLLLHQEPFISRRCKRSANRPGPGCCRRPTHSALSKQPHLRGAHAQGERAPPELRDRAGAAGLLWPARMPAPAVVPRVAPARAVSKGGHADRRHLGVLLGEGRGRRRQTRPVHERKKPRPPRARRCPGRPRRGRAPGCAHRPPLHAGSPACWRPLRPLLRGRGWGSRRRRPLSASPPALKSGEAQKSNVDYSTQQDMITAYSRLLPFDLIAWGALVSQQHAKMKHSKVSHR